MISFATVFFDPGELQVSNGELKNVDSQIKILTSQPTNSEARQASDGLREDIERLEAKLQTLTDANRPVITKKDKQKVEKAHEEAVKGEFSLSPLWRLK